MFLNTFDSDTTNQNKYLNEDKTKCIDKDKTPIPSSCDAPPTSRLRSPSRHADALLRPFHASSTQL